jgi:hypothetical protein
MFQEFALEMGAISLAEKIEFIDRGERAFLTLATLQSQYQVNDPAARFLALLKAALACGRGHVADRRGGVPKDAAVWGWQHKSGDLAWAPGGIRIGWVVGPNLFWIPLQAIR